MLQAIETETRPSIGLGAGRRFQCHLDQQLDELAQRIAKEKQQQSWAQVCDGYGQGVGLLLDALQQQPLGQRGHHWIATRLAQWLAHWRTNLEGCWQGMGKRELHIFRCEQARCLNVLASIES